MGNEDRIKELSEGIAKLEREYDIMNLRERLAELEQRSKLLAEALHQFTCGGGYKVIVGDIVFEENEEGFADNIEQKITEKLSRIRIWIDQIRRDIKDYTKLGEST